MFIYISRLDYSPLDRKLETFGAGFPVYCGFIHIEAVHWNPIMVVVTSYLYSWMKAKQYATQNLTMMIKNDTKISENYYYSRMLFRKILPMIYLSIFVTELS